MLQKVSGHEDGVLLEGQEAPAGPVEGAEEALILRAMVGDEVAFTRLYDTHYDRVYRYTLRLVRRVEDAEDLTQRVFLQAWRGLGRYRRTGSPFVAWLITIAHNQTMSFFRSHKQEARLEYDLLDEDEAGAPLETQRDLDEQEILREAILQLGPEQQQVITMHFFEGFKYDEIAASLGKSEGNVRVIQHRALQQLRGVLDARGANGKI